jgi:hypothetical protein
MDPHLIHAAAHMLIVERREDERRRALRRTAGGRHERRLRGATASAATCLGSLRRLVAPQGVARLDATHE